MTLQTELVRQQVVNVTQSAVPVAVSAAPGERPANGPRPPQPQRTLLSSTFTPLNPTGMIINPAARLASSLNPMNMPRNVLSVAGDRLRDLIAPDALANAIGAGVGGMGIMWEGMGLPTTFGGDTGGNQDKAGGARDPEKIRQELDDLLAASCPLCDSVVAGLDKPFIVGNADKSWQI